MNRQAIDNVRNHKALRIFDLIALALFLVAVTALIVVALMPEGDRVEVYEDGRLVYSLSLEDYGEYDVSGKLTIVIDSNGVCVKDADCPDKLCEMQGYISTSGSSLVCLPSKISVIIKGEQGVDVVS